MEWSHRNVDPTSPPFPSSPSLRQKIRSANCFSCCFHVAGEEDEDRPAVAASLIRSSSTWIRSKAGELPEIRERYRGLMSRIGKPSRRGFGEFKYDPLSYALNFDEGGDDEDPADAEEFRYRNFSSRLPASPPQPSVVLAGG